MIGPRTRTLAAFARARFLMSRLTTRADLTAFQARKLRQFLTRDISNVAAYRHLEISKLADAPTTDKSQHMQTFEAYNRLGVTARQGWDIFNGKVDPPKGYAIGASTGTSGNRGLYIVSDAERYTWLGVMLSRAFPGLLTQKERVAVILPQASRLYDAANESQRLVLRFFDLTRGIEAQMPSIAAFQPTVLVAPPRVLTVLAGADHALAPRQIFSGAEVLDPIDKRTIETRFAAPVREIYMATEGLFAVACRFGTPHLIEDHLAFEWLDVENAPTLKTPLVTDFSRRTQIMLRYRMNDLVELSDTPCPCGSPHQGIRQIVGRCDDAFTLNPSDGQTVTLTPDIIRNAVLNADRQIMDYRVIQTGPQHIQLELPKAHSAQLPAAKDALQALFAKAGVAPIVTASIAAFPDTGARKRRRVLVDMDRAAP